MTAAVHLRAMRALIVEPPRPKVQAAGAVEDAMKLITAPDAPLVAVATAWLHVAHGLLGLVPGFEEESLPTVTAT